MILGQQTEQALSNLLENTMSVSSRRKELSKGQALLNRLFSNYPASVTPQPLPLQCFKGHPCPSCLDEWKKQCEATERLKAEAEVQREAYRQRCRAYLTWFRAGYTHHAPVLLAPTH